MKELNKDNLQKVSGGIPPVIVAIGAAAGIVAAANEIYKFSRGFRDGYNEKK